MLVSTLLRSKNIALNSTLIKILINICIMTDERRFFNAFSIFWFAKVRNRLYLLRALSIAGLLEIQLQSYGREVRLEIQNLGKVKTRGTGINTFHRKERQLLFFIILQTSGKLMEPEIELEILATTYTTMCMWGWRILPSPKKKRWVKHGLNRMGKIAWVKLIREILSKINLFLFVWLYSHNTTQ